MPDEPQSIASDRAQASLPADTRRRLAEKFVQFREDREKIRRRMESYVVDYRLHEEGATRKYEALEEQYSADASDLPNLNHLVFREDDTVLWSMRDIAIVLGRNVSNVHRNLERMRAAPIWSQRLAAVSVIPPNPGRGAATLFLPEVFDILVDFFEERYLERVISPRHGARMDDVEARAVRRFWAEMRTNPDTVDARAFEGMLSFDASKSGMASRVYQCLRMIVKRTFSVKIGALFLALFALVYELSRRLPLFNVAAPLLSLLALMAVVCLMLRRKWYTPWLADAGAFAVMLLLLWSLAFVAAPDGPASRLVPSLVKLNRENAHTPNPKAYLDLTAFDDERGRVHFQITPGRMAKEIFYRIDDEPEFRSTGFMPQTNSATGAPFPNLGIWVKRRDHIRVQIRYTGIDGETYGPYPFDVDTKRERNALIERYKASGHEELAELLSEGGKSGLMLRKMEPLYETEEERELLIKALNASGREELADLLGHDGAFDDKTP